MKDTRRIKRMARNKKKVPSLPLTSLMDVFTILVFFLLFHSSGSEVVEAPKQIKLPDSVVETKPRETVVSRGSGNPLRVRLGAGSPRPEGVEVAKPAAERVHGGILRHLGPRRQCPR